MNNWRQRIVLCVLVGMTMVQCRGTEPSVVADPPDPRQQPAELVSRSEAKDHSNSVVATPLTGEEDDTRLVLPDKTSVPVLNGARGAPEMGWPTDRTWSPITGKITDKDGVEWYVHKDGSHSTTQMIYHTHLGRKAPVTNVFNPIKE